MAKDAAYRQAEEKIEAEPNATELDLSEMELTEIPEAIANLIQLQSLNLSDNKITEIPEAIANLSQLQTLNLSGNKITEISEAISNLTQLQSLNLSSNKITELPEAIANLTQLQSLILASNQITEIPNAIVNLTQLQTLNLHNNHISEIPEEIANLTQLQSLFLYRNEIIKFPDTFKDLTNLRELRFSPKKLSKVPNIFRKLKSLRLLWLESGQLTSLPDWIGELTELKTLLLYNNEIRDLPESINNLVNLERISLEENPLNPELAKANEQGLDAIKAYLRAKAEEQIILNEAKLILVGEGEVGKTSLLGALRGDEWIENRQTTHGVEVDIKSLVVTEPESNTEITLNGWDFGGQNIYRHTHQIFFTAPAIYLAVWNPRRGPEQCRVDEWIKMVKHRAYEETRPDEKPRILVIATHGGPKERLDHIDEQSLRDEFGDLIVGFLHVDSKDESGLAQLKQLISQTAVNIPQVGRSVPASWKRVLDTIRQRSKTDAWISYEQFLTLCAEQNVDITLAKTYAAILNELGHLIHYSTDPILKDTVILKPEWLSKAISFVLEDKQVKKQNGLVRHSRLEQLWDDPARESDRYPKHLHPLFLKLMERCDLSYQVELPEVGAPPTNLMAQLVPSKRPDQWEQDWVLKAGDTEQTQICRILDAATGRTAEAEGLMYRLIVRFHRYSLGKKNYYKSRHWKNGMLLDDGFNGRAFIEEIDGDIYVRVRAAYPSWFLAHLCSEITWLV